MMNRNRFSTELQLTIKDITSGESIWSITGFSRGRPGEAAYDVNRKLIADLLSEIQVRYTK